MQGTGLAIRGGWLALLVAFLLVGLAAPSPAAAQPDSTREAILQAKGLPTDHTPGKALWRAIALPGWGQYYNRQYYKIPIVYAGLAGFTAAVVYTNDQYRFYHRAYLFRVYQGEEDHPYAEFEAEYRMLVDRIGGEIRPDRLQQQRDKYRRYRDLSVVGIGIYYALAVLDAYVSAHLLTFDVGEDLSMLVQPSATGVTTQLRWRF